MKRPNIDLRNWNLSDSGVIAVCRGGMLNHALTIDLGYNHIGADGGKAIAKCISASKLLRSINIAYKNLEGEAAKALGPAISVSESLTSMDVGDNGITGDGALSSWPPWCSTNSTSRSSAASRSRSCALTASQS